MKTKIILRGLITTVFFLAFILPGILPGLLPGVHAKARGNAPEAAPQILAQDLRQAKREIKEEIRQELRNARHARKQILAAGKKDKHAVSEESRKMIVGLEEQMAKLIGHVKEVDQARAENWQVTKATAHNFIDEVKVAVKRAKSDHNQY